ncbi:MAG: YceI family protein [Myxococcales bacterium]|nr:YceI family protein [Myxococcales bacterium]
MTGKHEGGFSDLKGTVRLVDGAPEKSSVHVDIDAASITSDAEKLTGHLKSPEFFDVGKFANITFDSTAVKAGGDKGATHTVTGNLALHGDQGRDVPRDHQDRGRGRPVEAEFSSIEETSSSPIPGRRTTSSATTSW